MILTDIGPYLEKHLADLCATEFVKRPKLGTYNGGLRGSDELHTLILWVLRPRLRWPFWGGETLLCDASAGHPPDVKHPSQSIECTTQRVNPDVNCGL